MTTKTLVLAATVALSGTVCANAELMGSVNNTNFGIVSNAEAADYYQIHRGSGVEQLALPVTVQHTTDGKFCLYAALYKDEAGVDLLATVRWATMLNGQTCPR